MKGLAALAVIGVFAFGLIGSWAFSQLSNPAGAAPPLQMREDQIGIFAMAGVFGGGLETGSDYRPLRNTPIIRLGLDPADYPVSSSFPFEAQFNGGPPGTNACMALYGYDASTAAIVPGSEICVDGAGGRLRSNAFSLPVGEREYLVLGKCELITATNCDSTSTEAARVIVEWTERTR